MILVVHALLSMVTSCHIQYSSSSILRSKYIRLSLTRHRCTVAKLKRDPGCSNRTSPPCSVGPPLSSPPNNAEFPSSDFALEFASISLIVTLLARPPLLFQVAVPSSSAASSVPFQSCFAIQPPLRPEAAATSAPVSSTKSKPTTHHNSTHCKGRLLQEDLILVITQACDFWACQTASKNCSCCSLPRKRWCE